MNAVDDPEHCSFIVPAVVTRGDLTVAISTGGKSPAAARLVKERIAEILGDEYAALVRLLGAHRGRMKDAVAGQGSRARAWKRMIDAGVLESLRCGDKAAADSAPCLRRCLTDACGTLGGGVARAEASARGRREHDGGPQRQDPAARTGRDQRRTGFTEVTHVQGQGLHRRRRAR